jgi:PKD repeat protein
MKNRSVLVILFFTVLSLLFSNPTNVGARIPDEDSPSENEITDTCPPIQNTPFFTIVYGSVTLNGSQSPIGSLVKAYSPRNDLVGCFAVTTAGSYGAMYIYGEDTSVVPSIPGMRNNEPVSFTINDLPATTSPVLLWANDKDLHAVNLVSQGVTANFSATPVSGLNPLVVQFTDGSAGTITSRQWEFGDGQTSVDLNPQHTYTTPGSYTVSLTVSGPAGSDVESKTNYISVFSEVISNFSADRTNGIAPLSVSFTNGSTGSYSNLSWSFGDGGTSTSTNPTHNYTTGGVYTVSLTASGPGGTDTETKSNYITVYSAVVAGFTASPLSGIVPLTVNFTNTSTGSYTNLSWNFGDGGSSTATNPSHVYSSSGTYSVVLTASGPGGTSQSTSTINVYTPAVASFDASPTSGIAPLNVTFTNTSTGDFSTLFWEFGDGNTSSEINPVHNYSTSGIFTVSLTVAGLGGSDSEVKTGHISVFSPTEAQFSGSPTSGIAPLSVHFTNQSSGDYTSQSWIFGDGASSVLSSPIHEYLTSGTYTVSLTIDGPGGLDQETKINYITVYDPVIADFSATPTSGIGPLEVTFTNLSTGDYDTLAWDFGDGGSSVEANPSHVYTAAGTYTVSLTVIGDGGTDVETKTAYITVYTAVYADFSADVTSGVAPLTVQFTNLSTGDYDTLTWDFGDGGSSVEASPSHVYTAAGTYTVSLTVTGDGGTDVETKTAYITVYTAVNADFSADVTSGIAPLTVQFTDLSTGDYDTLAWDFGDGGSSVEASPSHVYTAAGTYTVSLTVTGDGGTDVETKTAYITVYTAVNADFSADVTSGIAPLTVQFTDLSTGDYDTLGWDFGDGSTSNEQNPTHMYDSPGNYVVVLTVTGPGGTDTAELTIQVNPFTFYLPLVLR